MLSLGILTGCGRQHITPKSVILIKSGSMKTFSIAMSVCLATVMPALPAAAATIAVAAGDNLQQAIDGASPGDTIALAPGATFTGSFTLPPKNGDAVITIRTAGDSGLPGEGARVSPAHAAGLAKIRQTGGAPAFLTAAGAHHWRLLLLEVQGTGGGDLVTLGDGSSAQDSLSRIAHDLVVDRVYLHGDAGIGQKRGIALNSASTTVTGSYISDIKAAGQDSQALCGWNGPGPFTITNNYLEAAGENLMFGGADPSVSGLVPSDITIADNHLAKRTSWRNENWVVKNLLELKNARRVSIVRNTLEYNWQGGQSGFAVVFTVRNQDGGCPWCTVDHINFEQNIVRHSAAGINLLGSDDVHPSQQTQAIVVRNNVFADIDTQNWGGSGYILLLTGGPRDITIDHNTFAQDHASGIVNLDGPPVLGFVYSNNLAKHNTYGFIGTDHGIGNDSIAAFLPGAIVSRNVLAGGKDNAYPATNSFPSTAQFESQFVSYAGGDYRLTPGSAWRNAGTDGRDLGVLLDQGVGGGSSAPAPPPVHKVVLETDLALPPGIIAAPYAGSLTVSGGSGQYVWTMVSGQLPAGLSLDPASGTIAGMSTVFGSFPFVASVSDVPSGVQATATATLVIAPKPLTMTTASVPDAIINQFYTVSLFAADGAAPLRWSIVAGALPSGVTIDPVLGVISGTPFSLRPGRYTVTVGVTDSWTPAQTAFRQFTLSTTSAGGKGPEPEASRPARSPTLPR